MNKLIKQLVEHLLGIMGCEKAGPAPPLNFSTALLEGGVSFENMINVVQVGANDGLHGDPIHSFLMENKEFTNVLLIEPQSEIIQYLESTYATHPNTSIFNGAIGTDDSLLLYRIKPDLWSSFHASYLKNTPDYRAPSGLTSANKEHVLKAADAYLDHNLTADDAVEEIRVPCRRLRDLLSNMDFPLNIHLLQVDAEGADDQVIYACDIDELRPTVINFESIHLGNSKMENLEKFLSHNRYKIYHWNKFDTLAVRRPK